MSEHDTENEAGLWHHPDCDIKDVDHPGYLGYRCVDEHSCSLPFPGESGHGCLFPPGLHACAGCGVELDGDDVSDRCDVCASGVSS